MPGGGGGGLIGAPGEGGDGGGPAGFVGKSGKEGDWTAGGAVGAAGRDVAAAGGADEFAPDTALNSPIAWRWQLGHFSGWVSRWTSDPHDVQR